MTTPMFPGDRRKVTPVQKAWEAMSEIAAKAPGVRLEVREAPDRGKSFVRIACVVVDTGETYALSEAVRVRWVTLYAWAAAARPGMPPRRAYHAAKRILDDSPWRIPFVRRGPMPKDPTRELFQAVAGLPWPSRAGRQKDDAETKALKKFAKARGLAVEAIEELNQIPRFKPIRVVRD